MGRPDLDAIEARLMAATPGPWSTAGNFGRDLGRRNIWSEPEAGDQSGHVVAHDVGASNANLIAHAPTDLAALLAYVREVEAERDRLTRILRCERGEWAPEGWVYSFSQGRWDAHLRTVWRNGWMRRLDGSSYVAWGWEALVGGEQIDGVAPTALDAIEAANAARREVAGG